MPRDPGALVDVEDRHRWLEDLGDERTTRWLDEQRRHLTGWTDARRDRIDAVRRRLQASLGTGAQRIPVLRGARKFIAAADGADPVLKVIEDGRARVVWSGAGAGRPDALLGAWNVSHEGTRIAVCTSNPGEERTVLDVVDVATGALLDGPVQRVHPGSAVWLPGGEEFAYVVSAESGERCRRAVHRHRVGAPANEDVLLLDAGEWATAVFDLQLAPGSDRLVVHVGDGPGSAQSMWLVDLVASSAAVLVSDETASGRYRGRVEADGHLYIMTTVDAPFGRIVRVDPASPARENWDVVVPEHPGKALRHFCFLPGDAPRLAVLAQDRARSELRVHPADGTGEPVEVALPGVGTVTELASVPERPDVLAFTWTSFSTPPSVRVADLATGAHPAAGEAQDRAEPTVRQVHVRSADGTAVPMFVLGDTSGGPKPALLTGYGGFGVNQVPSYSAAALEWVRAGGIWAKVLARGGAELGARWHDDGRREHKRRTFDDFEAAAEHLIGEGWTTPSRLAATGTSNGGLTVAAAVTRRPDLFAAASCWSPLCDMVRYDRFGAAALWTDEYGSPEVAEELGWLAAYSPYHRVEDGCRYPDVLLLASAGDVRVDACHARKMCARLQEASPGTRTMLVHDSAAGHESTPVADLVRAASVDLVFLAEKTGLRIGDG
ncbi:prolyl oligopeptidase family protein [Saccharopolyspora gloriosae]|uniref:prolyl oligopeptidase n=1 Tax=Saccharopolyspora gloriosae TaxID=455344 RepID=A0A840NMY4_9PSEU|nr:prolyl oligopeptidase family serine peptidase [Saccharopolyspora gloriosae]MBB5071463.1 prolyl oligopeptidase [Saccharopolyspora gloriosae]